MIQKRILSKSLYATLAYLSLLSACRSSNDLGSPCTLVKLSADGGRAPVTNADLRTGTASNNDFISLGSVDCEELVCVREGTVAITGSDADPATGFCTRRCLTTNSQDCLSADQQVNRDPSTQFSCRQLLLDQQTLNAICSDPVVCRQSFGNARSPYYCAHSPSTDGGS